MADQKKGSQQMHTPALDAGLPANLAAERAVIGSILLENSLFAEASSKLEPSDFAIDSHRRIFLRMSELVARHEAVNIVTLSNELGRFKEVETIGGVAYIARLTEDLPLRLEIDGFVRIVKDRSLLRQLMQSCDSAIARAGDQSDPAIDVGLALANQVQGILATGINSSLERVSSYFVREFPTPESMVDETAKMRGLETGFTEFDEMTCGLQKQELIILAARPSMGKSALMANIAEHIGINCESKIAIFSLEMSKESFLRRAICSRGRVSLQDHRTGRMRGSQSMMERFTDAYQEFNKSDIHIDDRPKTALRLAAEIRSLKARKDLDLAMIDYLGLFQHDDKGRFNQSAQIGLDCLIMKDVAKELRIPIILLCQLSREVTKRTDKRPMLSDLRESGNIEEHADLVSFIHREGYYEKDDPKLKNKAEWIIAKQRNGPTGTIQLHWEPSYTRFSNPDEAGDAQFEFTDWLRRQ